MIFLESLQMAHHNQTFFFNFFPPLCKNEFFFRVSSFHKLKLLFPVFPLLCSSPYYATYYAKIYLLKIQGHKLKLKGEEVKHFNSVSGNFYMQNDDFLAKSNHFLSKIDHFLFSNIATLVVSFW